MTCGIGAKVPKKLKQAHNTTWRFRKVLQAFIAKNTNDNNKNDTGKKNICNNNTTNRNYKIKGQGTIPGA